MRLISLTVARNEGPFIGCSLRAALAWNDAAVILLHACTDNTRVLVEEIEEEYPGRARILEEPDGTWAEMAHRQRTLDEARRMGATHCSIVDADELLCGDLLLKVRAQIAQLQPGQCLGVPMKNLHRSIHQYRSDSGIWGARAGTLLAFADRPDLCWRAENGYDHHHRHPYHSRHVGSIQTTGGVMHLQFASWPRLVEKHDLYRVTERIRWPHKSIAEINQVYAMALNETGCRTSPVPEAWWQPYTHLMRYLDVDAEPWQRAEVRRLIDLHGRERFTGIDLFGAAARLDGHPEHSAFPAIPETAEVSPVR